MGGMASAGLAGGAGLSRGGKPGLLGWEKKSGWRLGRDVAGGWVKSDRGKCTKGVGEGLGWG